MNFQPLWMHFNARTAWKETNEKKNKPNEARSKKIAWMTWSPTWKTLWRTWSWLSVKRNPIRFVWSAAWRTSNAIVRTNKWWRSEPKLPKVSTKSSRRATARLASPTRTPKNNEESVTSTTWTVEFTTINVRLLCRHESSKLLHFLLRRWIRKRVWKREIVMFKGMYWCQFFI